MIPVYNPYFTKESQAYAIDAINSGWLSSNGKYLKLVEDRLCDILGVKHVLLTCNGTAANHLIAKAIKWKYPDVKSIIAPNNVYVAAWNPFLDSGYIMRLIDADIDSWNANIEDTIKECSNPNTAVLVVHNLGNPFPTNLLPSNAIVVEDNCEGFLGKIDGTYTGVNCLASSVSFYGNKNITCGEGGCVITNNTEIYEYMKLICRQGQSSKRFVHNVLGYNYRMTNVQAAILYGQISVLDEIQKLKQSLFNGYKSLLSGVDNISFQQTRPSCEHANWMFGIRFHNNDNYEMLESYFNGEGIEIRPMFYPANAHGYLKEMLANNTVVCSDFTNACRLNNEVAVFPSFPDLKQEELLYITKAIIDYAKNI